MQIYLWLYEECSVFNIVLVIKDQGYALTIDYIKKKQKLTLVSPHTARHHFIFINIKFSWCSWP